MRLVRYDGGRTGVLSGEAVLDAEAAVPELLPHPGASWRDLIIGWDDAAPALRALTGDGVPLTGVTLEPPLADPAARIFAMGGNFPMHTAATVGKLEMKISDSITKAADEVPPWGFYVIPGTIVGPDAVVSPPADTQKLDYEAELGVVRAACGAGFPIWGYMAWNDFSIRDAAFGLSKVDHGPLTWSLQKNFATANACGPWVVVDEPIPPAGLRIVCRVNGETRQDGVTTAMKYGFDAIAAHIEEYLPLGPGDLILSGTPAGTGMEGGPAGPFLADGDVTEVEITGASDGASTGVLRNRIALPAV
ncbi:MAG TPA: fumarylacetoacetate hydrolase family protein [Solirubrobacteraceae bacterium]|nr:fumarylacetoacetate hydrolase family protein [Solirubrobacteraceae bacterium]